MCIRDSSKLDRYSDILTIKEPEKDFLFALKPLPPNISNNLWSANVLFTQLTVMDAQLRSYKKTNLKTIEKKYIVLERDLESAKNIFTQLSNDDNRFLPQTKQLLSNITQNWIDRIPSPFKSELLIIIAPGKEQLQERIAKRQKEGDNLYNSAKIEQIVMLYKEYYKNSVKNKVWLNGDQNPETLTQEIYSIIKQHGRNT